MSFQFDRKGVIRVGASGEDALLTILDAGAEDAVEEDGEIIVYTELKDLAKVREGIKKEGLNVIEAELQYVPKNTVLIESDDISAKLDRVMDALDDLDDVVNVHTNAELPE